MSDPPASIPADWQMCNTAKSFHETVAGHGPTTDDGLWYRKVVENRHGKTAEGLWYVHLRMVIRDAHVSIRYIVS
jgi:acid phosphatase